MKHKLESILLGKYQSPQICRWHHPYGRKWRRTKEPLDESEKVGLKLNIKKLKITESGSITSWQIDGETVETVSDFFLGSKITADGDWSHEIKRCLLLRREATTNLLLLLLLSRFSRVQLCVTPWMAAHKAPPSLGFSRQEHWSGLPFPSPMHESEKRNWSCSVVSDS